MKGKSDHLVPRAVFDTREVAGSESLAAWQELTKPVYAATALCDPHDYAASIQGYLVGDLIIQRVRFSATLFKRERRHLRNEGDFLVLCMPVRGVEQIIMDTGQHELRPGMICLRDWARGFHSATTSVEHYSIIIPRHHLKASDVLYTRAPFVAWSRDKPVGRLLALTWQALEAELPMAGLEDSQHLAAGLLGLLNGVLQPDRVPHERATLEAMKTHLLARLQQPDAGVDELCAAFGVSRATVYRLFRTLGGVRHYLTAQRLLRCYAELRSTAPRMNGIATVAAHWCFYEPSSFTRLFKKTFGVKPSDILGIDHDTLREPISECITMHSQLLKYRRLIEHIIAP